MEPQICVVCMRIDEKRIHHINGLVQKRRNSIANALELCLSCTNPSIFELHLLQVFYWYDHEYKTGVSCALARLHTKHSTASTLRFYGNTVGCWYNMVQYNIILHIALWDPSRIYISRVSCQKGPICHALAWLVGPFWQDTLDIRVWSHKRDPYLALTDELWGVHCEEFWENWPCYNSTILYVRYNQPNFLDPTGCVSKYGVRFKICNTVQVLEFEKI